MFTYLLIAHFDAGVRFQVVKADSPLEALKKSHFSDIGTIRVEIIPGMQVQD